MQIKNCTVEKKTEETGLYIKKLCGYKFPVRTPCYLSAFSLLFLLSNGLAILSLKSSINGPMKKAVTMVPTPTMVGMDEIVPPPNRKTIIPAMTQTRSVPTRQNLNLATFHLLAYTIATAS